MVVRISVVVVAVVCGYAFVLVRDLLVGGLCSGVGVWLVCDVCVRRGACRWLRDGVVVGVSDGVLVGEYHVGLFVDFTTVG